jgi:hypothetical protein
MTWMVAVVAAVAVAGGATLAIRAATGEELEAGFVTSGSSGTKMEHELTVEIPIGTITLGIGEPLEEIAARRAGKGEGTISVEDGAVIVPVSWHFGPTLSYEESLLYPMEFSLTLRSGDARYGLGTPEINLLESAESGLLPEADLLAVVDGDGTDLELDVTYEEETQTADVRTGHVDRGRAEQLYLEPALQDYSTNEHCDPYRTRQARYVDAGYSGFSCMVRGLFQSPYLPELGWAAEGRVWSSIDVRISAPRVIRWLLTGDRYRVERGPISVKVDSQEPVRVSPLARNQAAQGGTYVFDTALGEPSLSLHVSAPLAARPSPDATGGPASIRFGVDQTFELIP